MATEAERRFLETAARVAGELGVTRPLEPALRLPAPLRDSILEAASLEPSRREDVLTFYGERMPRLLVEQRYTRDAVHALLRAPLDRAALRGLDAALRGAREALRACGIDPGEILGDAPTSSRPSVLSLVAPTVFGAGLPMLGCYPHERPVLLADLEAGRPLEAVVDHRLGANLMHELCHGLHYEGPRAPWIVQESAAAHLGYAAHPAHLVPTAPGAGLPAALPFVRFAAALARRYGAAALYGALAPGWSGFEPRVDAAIRLAEWETWLESGRPAFVVDMLQAEAWIKLADAARDPDFALPDRPGAAQPSLLERAAARPWSALPWWSEAVDEADIEVLRLSLHALFVSHVMAPNFQIHPAPLPGARAEVHLEACVIEADPRPDGVWGEPASGLVPPPIARVLLERGAHHVALEGLTLARLDAALDALMGGLTRVELPERWVIALG